MKKLIGVLLQTKWAHSIVLSSFRKMYVSPHKADHLRISRRSLFCLKWSICILSVRNQSTCSLWQIYVLDLAQHGDLLKISSNAARNSCLGTYIYLTITDSWEITVCVAVNKMAFNFDNVKRFASRSLCLICADTQRAFLVQVNDLIWSKCTNKPKQHITHSNGWSWGCPTVWVHVQRYTPSVLLQ